MTKTKWHSKLLSLSIAFALVFSLVAMVAPVNTARAQGSLDLDVSVDEQDVYCCCDYFNVTAVIDNNMAYNATDVNATLTIDGNAELISPDPMISCGNITEGEYETVIWEVHCTGWDTAAETKFTVEVTSTNSGTVSDYAEVLQESGWLEATITSPEQDDVFPVCSVFNVTFFVENTGCNNVTSVWAEVSTVAGAEIWPSGLNQISVYIGDIAAGQCSENKSVEIHCTGVGQAILHVDPLGLDVCSLKEIEGDSAVVEIEQVFGVACNVTPNPTKVGHNVTFVAEVGSEADPDLDYVWAFGDGDTATGTVSSHTITEYHTYTTDGNYTAMCQVTDDNDITVNCTGTVVVVHPVLGVNCWIRTGTVAVIAGTPDRYMAKTDAPVCFNATRIGGLPEGSDCYDGNTVSYSWFWDFGDGTNSTAQNPCHTYNVTGNYTATVTLEDDCLLNVAECNKTVEIYDPLGLSCNVTPDETKIGHEVTFNATLIGGLPTPPVTYNWQWDFGDGSAFFTCGPNTTHLYTTSGTYYPVVKVWDGTALNNTANCTSEVLVHPGLNVTCNVTPDPQNVCHAVNFTAVRFGGVPGNSYNWTWTFSDNTTAVGQNVTKVFMCIGNYTGTVTLTDEDLGNTANCTAEVEIIIEPPDLIAPELNETVLSRWVTFNWTDIGCCNYTLEVWQKDGAQVKVLLADTGKDNFWSGWIMDGDKYKWQVTATDSCGNSATSEASYFEVQDTYLDVSVDAPMTGDSFPCDSTTTIIWSTERDDSFAGFGASGDEEIEVALYYSTNSGTDWTSIATGQAATGSIAWAVPAAVNSDQCLIKAVASDGYGNEGVGISGLFSIVCIVEPDLVTSYNITLNEGWNLISLPLIPTSNNISAVLAGAFGTGNITQVWAYDPSLLPGDAWLSYYTFLPWSANELKEMNDGVGYWIVVQGGTATLTINGQCMPDPGEVPPMYDVYAGWNLIGMKSLATRAHDVYLANVSGMYTVIWAYDTVSGNYELVYAPGGAGSGVMNPGEGFWIYMQADGVIVPTGC